MPLVQLHRLGAVGGFGHHLHVGLRFDDGTTPTRAIRWSSAISTRIGCVVMIAAPHFHVVPFCSALTTDTFPPMRRARSRCRAPEMPLELANAREIGPRAVILPPQHGMAVVSCQRALMVDGRPCFSALAIASWRCGRMLLPVDVEGDPAPIAVKRRRDARAGGDGFRDILDHRG